MGGGGGGFRWGLFMWGGGGLVQMGVQRGEGSKGETLGGLEWSKGANVEGGGGVGGVWELNGIFCNLSLGFEMD